MKRCYSTDTQVLNEELIVSVTVNRGERETALWSGKVEFLWRENWLQVLWGFSLFSVVYWLYDHQADYFATLGLGFITHKMKLTMSIRGCPKQIVSIKH